MIPESKRLQTESWEWWWSGNWPLFDYSPFMSEEYIKEWKSHVGFAPEAMVCFYQDGTVTAYLNEQDQQKLKQAFHTLFQKDPRFLLKTMRDYEQRNQKYFQTLKTIMAKDLAKTPNQELAQKLLKVEKILSYNCFIDHYDYYLERYFAPLIENWLADKEMDHFLRSQMVSLLIRPQFRSPYAKERTAFLQILQLIRKNTRLSTAIKAGKGPVMLDNYPAIERKLQAHLRQWRYLRVVVNGVSSTIDDLWKEIKEYVIGKPFEVKETRQGDRYDPQLIKDARALERKLRPDAKTKALIQGVRRAVCLRLLDNEFQGRTTTLLEPLYNETARRLDLTHQDLKQFTSDELRVSLVASKKFTKTQVAERRRIACYLKFCGTIKLYIGREAEEIKAIVERKSEEECRIFQGTSASPGVYRGKVRLALTWPEAQQLQQGEILVTPQPSAFFVPILRKAAAIVTEYGGVTNHAVIVARENKLPCIIGVKGITKHLQTGDEIEVDATQGTVTKC